MTVARFSAYTPPDTIAEPAWRPRLRAVLWMFVVLLSAIGIISATMRLAIGGEMRRAAAAGATAKLTATDERSLDFALTLRGVPPASAEAREPKDFLLLIATRFADRPLLTALHMVPGIVLMLLMPMQFVSRIRNRNIRVHRWTGRTILVFAFGTAISALYFGVINPTVARIEAPAIGTFLFAFVFALTRGWFAIRGGDMATHREWMTRAYAIVLGIATVRLTAVPMTMIRSITDPGMLLILNFWVGWLLTVGVAELWIRATRMSRRPRLTSRARRAL